MTLIPPPQDPSAAVRPDSDWAAFAAAQRDAAAASPLSRARLGLTPARRPARPVPAGGGGGDAAAVARVAQRLRRALAAAAGVEEGDVRLGGSRAVPATVCLRLQYSC